MTAQRDDVESVGESALLTVDELAAATGTTVRTTRYYAGLGLLPPPMRRGRMAYYSAEHRARLELIRALQEHGFTLAAIEKYFARIPDDASVEDLALQRAMLTSWKSGGYEVLTRRQLEARAGRKLREQDVAGLVGMMAVQETADGRFEILPAFEVSLQILDLKIPMDSVVAAGTTITRHMESLVDDLTVIMRKQVVAPFREGAHSVEEKAAFEETVARLRQLTLEAVVSGFRRAADEVISRSLNRGTD